MLHRGCKYHFDITVLNEKMKYSKKYNDTDLEVAQDNLLNVFTLV